MPVTLDVTEEFAKKIAPGSGKVALRDGHGIMPGRAALRVWQADRAAEPKAVFNSTSKVHPRADYTINKSNRVVPWRAGCRRLRKSAAEFVYNGLGKEKCCKSDGISGNGGGPGLVLRPLGRSL